MSPDGSQLYTVYDILSQLRRYVPIDSCVVGTSMDTETLYSFAVQHTLGTTLYLVNMDSRAQGVTVDVLPNDNYNHIRPA